MFPVPKITVTSIITAVIKPITKKEPFPFNVFSFIFLPDTLEIIWLFLRAEFSLDLRTSSANIINKL